MVSQPVCYQTLESPQPVGFRHKAVALLVLWTVCVAVTNSSSHLNHTIMNKALYTATNADTLLIQVKDGQCSWGRNQTHDHSLGGAATTRWSANEGKEWGYSNEIQLEVKLIVHITVNIRTKIMFQYNVFNSEFFLTDFYKFKIEPYNQDVLN